MSTQTLTSVGGSGDPHVVIVGAGMVGLSTAWFLQERGVRVTVLERSGIAAGSSWGNAGWISPGLAIPLADPSVLAYGIKALADPDSPLYLPIRQPSGSLLRFMLGFTRRCTMPQWRRTMAAMVPVNRQVLDAFDELEASGLQARSLDAPILAAFARAKDADALRHEVELIREAGLDLQTTELDSSGLQAAAPQIAPEVEAGIRIDGQRFIDPGAYVSALADAVRSRGGEVVLGAHVHALRHGARGVTVELYAGEPVHADAVVIATGAWLPELASTYGVRVPFQAGRGYSFTVPWTGEALPHPVYFPTQRVACTPLGGRLRVGGTMEFRGPDEAFDVERIEAIVRSAQHLLEGVDWADRRDEWVGSRPVTVDGLSLIGPTRAPRVWVHGGHGMWGITQGPATGRLLAEYMVTGRRPEILAPYDPLR